MNKKIKLLSLIFILFLVKSVYAESATITLNCPATSVEIGVTIPCNMSLEAADTTINKIEMDYSVGSMDFEFIDGDGVSSSISGNKLTINFDDMIFGSTPEKNRLGLISISTSNASAGEIDFVLSNIVISKDNDENYTFNQQDIKKVITLKTPTVKSSDNKLTKITIDGVSLNGFSSTKFTYNDIVVENETISIDAIKNDDKASVSGLGKVLLKENQINNVVISVMAEDGSIQNYTLQITYNSNKSKDNNLKTLELYHDKDKIEFEYDSSKSTFDLDIDDDTIEKITIKSAVNDNKASYVKNYGNRDINLNYGENKVEIKVQAENGDVKVYTLNINKKDNRSNDNTLSMLSINEQSITLIDDILEYNINLRYNAEKTSIIVKTNSEKAKISYKDIDLVDGENPPVIITVTAENGEKKEYKLNIKRLSEEDSKIVLEKISITEYELNFDIDKHDYDLLIPSDVDKLNISVIPSNDLKYEILGNSELKNGSTIIIRVNDDEGTKTYNINILKDSKKLFGVIPLNIFCYCTFGIGCILLTIALVYHKKNKKEKNKE